MTHTAYAICAASALVATAAGCLSTPAYQPPVAVAYADDGSGGGTASAPGFSLHFAGGADGFHFPDRLAIDGTDILGHDPASTCFDENEAGIQIKPTPRISADGMALQVTNQLVPALRGPAVVQIQLTWATRLSCSTTRAPHGTSTFTVFPDGRIVRRDTLDDASSMTLTAITCACDQQGNSFTVSSYWTLARTPFLGVELPGEERPLPKDDADIGNIPIACLAGTAYHLGSGWRENAQSTIHGTDAVVAIGRYRIFGDSNLDAFPWDTSSALFIDRTGCDAVLRRTHEYAAPSPLTVNGTAVIASERDGIYGGDTADGPAGIALATDRAELTGPVDDAFAVWLQFPGAVDAVRASLPGATGAWYLPQQIDDRSWIVWFRDPLRADQTIVIEPR